MLNEVGADEVMVGTNQLGQLRFEGLYAIPVKRCCEICQRVMNNTVYPLTLARAGPHYSFTILGAFTKLRKRLLALCLSDRMEQLGSHWTDFREI